MSSQRQGKIEARELKNILVSSRNQSETLGASTRGSQLKKTATFEQRMQDSNLKVSVENRVMASSRRSQESSSSNKQLKLKDYIHLNGLEKKSKSKSNISSSEHIKTEKSISQTEPPPLVSAFSASADKKESTLEKPAFLSNKKIPDNDYYLMIRQEITAKIEQQRKKLGDLETWLMRDFQPKDNQTQTFVFLFNMLNKMGEVHAINEDVGLSVKQYENADGLEGGRRRVMKKESYHWEEAPKELDSPAKIMQSAMKLTFDLASLLNIPK